MTWEEYFLSIAWIVKEKSPDTTKHGCVLVDKDHRIVGTGYNGYAKGFNPPDHLKERPNKYFITSHAEESACLFTQGKPHYAFITGAPCPNCLVRLIQKGVREIYMIDRKGYSKEEGKEAIEEMIHQKGLKIKKLELPFHVISESISPPKLMYTPTQLY